jgi:hypothetical protein
VPEVVVDLDVVVVVALPSSMDGNANPDVATRPVEVMAQVGFSPESSRRERAAGEARVATNMPIIASNKAGVFAEFVRDGDGEVGAVRHLPGEVKAAPSGAS